MIGWVDRKRQKGRDGIEERIINGRKPNEDLGSEERIYKKKEKKKKEEGTEENALYERERKKKNHEL